MGWNKGIEDFDFSKNPNVPPEAISTLAQPAWVQAGNPLCLIGDSGTGKSHPLIGLGTAIAEAGGRVRYTTAANLVNELAEATSDKQLGPHDQEVRPGGPALPGRADPTFTYKRLCQAIVDRLTFEAHFIETGTQSFRLASTTAKRKAAAA
ncbi:ATP-binding protein [Streptomyces sp. NPDC127112]|uniref:ATP-binding protein n=1 Tax=Streptomyces sp. NPDC127112 TaxID=3345364 RepID=UPI00362D0442